MKNVIVEKHHKVNRQVSASGFTSCLVAAFSAFIATGMLGISLGLSWPEYLSLTLTAAALTFGVVFTIFEMRRLTDKER
jgi:Kef-type K+ transport system membrane component KefB